LRLNGRFESRKDVITKVFQSGKYFLGSGAERHTRIDHSMRAIMILLFFPGW
jgi:hypothetical protein